MTSAARRRAWPPDAAPAAGTGTGESDPVPGTDAGHPRTGEVEHRREAERLAALRRYEILNTPDEEAFDRVARLASTMFGTPIADVSLIDEDRQWLKASSVPDRPREALRAWSFCAHAIRGDDVMVVPDAREDARFRANPFVAGEPRIRFYAGAPLRTPDGHAIGALCVISPEPRAGFDEADRRKLRALADIVMDELELRRRRRGDARILDRLLEHSSDRIEVLDLDGVVQFANEGGRAPAEPDGARARRGQPWTNAWAGAAHAAALQALAEARAGRTSRFEGRAATAEGVPTWWDVTVSPVPGEDGRPERLLAIARDITERKRAEAALRASERRLRATHDNAGVGLHEVDAEGRYLNVNATFTRMTGYTTAQLAGRSFLDLIDDAAERERAGAAFERLVRGEVNLYEDRRAYTDTRGRRWWAEMRTTAVRDEAGRFLYAVRVVEDVTEAHRAEERLRASEARLRELVGTLDLAAIMVRDLDGTIRFWSKGCERLYGWTAEQAVGRAAHELLRVEYPVPLAAVEAALLRDGEWRGDLGHVRRDGTTLLVAAYKALRRDEQGGPAAVTESLADVTELRQAQAALERLNAELEGRVEARTAELIAAEASLRQSQKMEAVGQLTGGIAHDFNNMLQAIGGSLELMQRRLAQGRTAEAGRYAEVARQTVERAAALTQRLLAFARRQALRPELVKPDALVEGMAELIRRTMGPGIAVELCLRDGLWSVLCDPNQLENALLNLAINARDAMAQTSLGDGGDAAAGPDGGRLTIGTADVALAAAEVAGQEGAAPGDYVEIAVTDTGAGMDEATRARAFEPFFTTKPLGQGTGLGLSQVYGFVRQSGGFVRLDSAPGRGTTVRLYLPRHEPAREQQAWQAMTRAAPVIAGSPVAGASGTVLLVEDEACVRAVAAEHLRELGYRVLEAADGPAALRLLHTEGARVDVLVTDVGLPGGLNGRQVADAARVSRPGLPVLFITGYAGSALEDRLASGMAVVGKPFALDALAAQVRTMLEAAPIAS